MKALEEVLLFGCEFAEGLCELYPERFSKRDRSRSRFAQNGRKVGNLFQVFAGLILSFALLSSDFRSERVAGEVFGATMNPGFVIGLGVFAPEKMQAKVESAFVSVISCQSQASGVGIGDSYCVVRAQTGQWRLTFTDYGIAKTRKVADGRLHSALPY